MFIALLIFWLICAGGISATTLGMGVVVCGLITLFCAKFMGYSPKKMLVSVKKAGRAVMYLLLLIKEVVAANICVLKLIYKRGQPRSMLVRFDSPLRTKAAEVLVANSITLTPGTYTVGLKNGEYVVHALDKSLAEGIEDCAFFNKARALEEG